MHDIMGLKTAIAVTCACAAIFAAVVWNFRKSLPPSAPRRRKRFEEEFNNLQGDRLEIDERTGEPIINDLPEPRWVKVGQVEEIFYYPLKSGRGKTVESGDFGKYGVCVSEENRFTIRDRMFLVYNEEKRHFETGRNHPNLLLANLTAEDETTAKLEAPGMPSIAFKLPDYSEKDATNYVNCTMWFGEPVKCIDCGPEVAKWISKYLIGADKGLRVGCATPERRDLLGGPMKRYAEVYDTLRNNDSGLFSDLTSYMILSASSLDTLNEKLEKPVPAMQFRPNLVVSGSDPFAEDDWEWIKIGKRVVLRNVKPCTRCGMIRIDTETATPDKEEPTKTLQTFRALTDPKRVALDGKVPVMGIYCGLYVCGRVNVGDDVFVHAPRNPLKSIS